MRTLTPVRSVTPLALVLALASATAAADVVIPSSAFSAGANNAEFHSDVRIFNPSTTTAVLVTPVFYNQVAGGAAVPSTPPTITIPPRTQVEYDNVLSSLFGQSKGVFGPIRFQTPASLIVSSSVNNVNSCGTGATSGQWLPGLDQSQSLRAGTLVQLAASANAASGYRSNVVFMNPGASSATVSSNLRKGDGTLISSANIGPLAPNGFTQIGGLSAWLPSPNSITDTNLWLEFTSDQPVLAFASVINNASGDPFAIVMTAEPNVSAPVLAPVASYNVSPASPNAGQPATFTDTSTNGPVNRFWVFGDGAVATNPAAPVQHTYASPGTYHSALLVDNTAGASSATKDVVVASAAPVPVSILATTNNNTRWTFVCQSPASVCSGAGNNNVNLKVGQPYTITWTTPQSENNVHGVSELVFLGLAGCGAIRPNLPCTLNVTPTAAMLALPGPTYTYNCTQSSCGVGHSSMSGTITIVP